MGLERHEDELNYDRGKLYPKEFFSHVDVRNDCMPVSNEHVILFIFFLILIFNSSHSLVDQ